MRSRIKLSEGEKSELERLKKEEKNNKIYRRYIYVELSNKGMTNLEISKIIGVCNDTLTDWKSFYTKGGLKELSKLNYDGRRESKLTPLKDKIINEIDNNDIPTLKKLKNFLKKEYNVEVEQSWLSRFCKKNSIYLTKKRD